MNLALFDLDHTLIPLDSDYEWGQFMVRIGAVDAAAFGTRNAEFYEQYQRGTLDPNEYLNPALRPAAHALLKKHQDAGDLIAIVTATNRFVTAPIALAFGVEHLIAAEPELTADGELTGKPIGIPPYGAGKVANTHAWLAAMNKSLADFERSYFYSDSQNDIPLLSIVTHPVATNPNAKLAAYAQEKNWPILKLFND